MALTPKKAKQELLGGKFVVVPFTDEHVAFAVSEARRLGFVHILIVGERGDARCGIVNVNCASILHLTEILDNAMNRLPAWQSAPPANTYD